MQRRMAVEINICDHPHRRRRESHARLTPDWSDQIQIFRFLHLQGCKVHKGSGHKDVFVRIMCEMGLTGFV